MGIVETISKYVKLTKVGKTYKGLCPFHDEKTPSFTIYPKTQTYYCFGCHEYGQVNDFLKKIDGSNDKMNKDDSYFERLSKAYKDISIYTNLILVNTDYGKRYLSYLISRNISINTINKFRIGCFESNKKSITVVKNIANKYDIDVYDLGLIKNNRIVLDKYITFPLVDRYSRVFSFTGRNISNLNPKYLNIENNEYISKSELCFKSFSDDKEFYQNVIVSEGVFDVLRLYELGVENCISVLGSKPSQTQIKIINQFNKIILMFDGDRAGDEGVSSFLLRNQNRLIDTYIYILPDGQDPDSHFNNKKDKVKDIIELAKRGIDYILEEIVNVRSVSDLSTKKNALVKISKYISRDDPMKYEILKYISKKINIDISTTKILYEKNNFINSQFTSLSCEIINGIEYFKCGNYFYIFKRDNKTLRVLLNRFENINFMRTEATKYQFDSGENIIIIMQDEFDTFFSELETNING